MDDDNWDEAIPASGTPVVVPTNSLDMNNNDTEDNKKPGFRSFDKV